MSIIQRPTIKCDHCGYLHEEHTKPISWIIYNLGGWVFCSEECHKSFIIPEWSYLDEEADCIITTEKDVQEFITDDCWINYNSKRMLDHRIESDKEFGMNFMSHINDGNMIEYNCIDHYVEYWHTHDTGMELDEFLGMTEKEYGHWVETNELPKQ
jgi:hypothetical protein